VLWEPVWVSIPPGTFPFGDPSDKRRGEVEYPFQISKYEVPNSLWFDYLSAERAKMDMNSRADSFPQKREEWSIDPSGNVRLKPGRRGHPVTNVPPVAIAEFCAWLTRRLGDPAFEIRMPTQLEWEYAARGEAGRNYTWGNDDVVILIPQSGGNTRLRAGIGTSAYAVDDVQLAEDDASPFGVVAMGTNVSEWNVMPSFSDEGGAGTPEIEVPEFLSIFAPVPLQVAVRERQLNVAWRGASFSCDADDARRLARPWSKVNSEPRNARDDVGIRLVKVKVAR